MNDDVSDHRRRDMRPGWRVLAWGAALAALALVFSAYLNPHTAVDLANRVWACF
jgi:hypothetical protein